MITLAIFGLYGIITLAGIYLAFMLPAVYVAVKNEQFPFLLPWILLIVLLPVIGVVVYTVMYFNRKKHRSQFEALLIKKSGEENKDHNNQHISSGIPNDIVAHILTCLDTFEKEEEYLKPKITPANLADTFDTDSRYLSKIIKTYKKKKLKAYINTLRIDYLVEKIRSGDDLKKYTSKAAARELGFSSATAFSLAFLKRTGMYHYPFVEQFETDEEEQWAF